jgi:plasmid maintenance system antidote protein VapI
MDRLLGQAIKQQLVESNLTQADLARLMGIEPQQLNAYLAGRRGLLTGMAERILEEMGLDIVLIERKK